MDSIGSFCLFSNKIWCCLVLLCGFFEKATAATETAAAYAACPQASGMQPEVKGERALASNDKLGGPELKPIPQYYGYRVIARYPHDVGAFTEGLTFYNGRLFESTGQWGQSSLRELDLQQGRIKQQVKLSRYDFGEGLTVLNNYLVQLTWKSGEAFIYQPDTLKQVSQFGYEGEGWGVAAGNGQLVVSNGSAQLQFFDTENFNVVRRLTVTDRKHEIAGLNELEFAEGAIFANVWPSNCIAEIDPATGQVLGWLDLAGLAHSQKGLSEMSVLNGMAYNAETKHWLVTGKNWPYFYEITLQRTY